MTDAQARLLWDSAQTVPAGSAVVEIGSHYGRSTALLASAAADGVPVFAIDPHTAGPYASASEDEGELIHRSFHANLGAVGVEGKVEHLRLRSQDPAALSRVEAPVGMLYVDGDHRYDRARDDLRLWSPRVAMGGHVLVHDAYSSPYVTAAVLRTMGLSREFSYRGREGSLVHYVRSDLAGGRRAANTLAQAAPLWWQARNGLVKLALKRGRPDLARRLGHPDASWPY